MQTICDRGLIFKIYKDLMQLNSKKTPNSSIKKWGTEERDYAHEKWTFRFYVIAFFVGIPILLLIALWQELVK